MRTYKEPKRIDKQRPGIVNPVEYGNIVSASYQQSTPSFGDCEGAESSVDQCNSLPGGCDTERQNDADDTNSEVPSETEQAVAALQDMENGDIKTMEGSVIEYLNSLPNNHNKSQKCSEDALKTVKSELDGIISAEPVVSLTKLKKTNSVKTSRKRDGEACNDVCEQSLPKKAKTTKVKAEKKLNSSPKSKVKSPSCKKKPTKKTKIETNDNQTVNTCIDHESPKSDHSTSPRASKRTPKKNSKYSNSENEEKENSKESNQASEEAFSKKRKLIFNDEIKENGEQGSANEVKNKSEVNPKPTKAKKVSKKKTEKVDACTSKKKSVKKSKNNSSTCTSEPGCSSKLDGEVTEEESTLNESKVEIETVAEKTKNETNEDGKKKKSVKKSKLSRRAKALLGVEESIASAVKETMDFMLKEITKMHKKEKKSKKKQNSFKLGEEKSSKDSVNESVSSEVESQNDTKPSVKKDLVTVICQHCGHVSHSKGANTRHLRKCVVNILKGDMPLISPTRASNNSLGVDSPDESKTETTLAEEKSLILLKLDTGLKKVENAESGTSHYCCQHCSYSSPKRAMLARHMRTHGIYVCLRCNFISDSHDGLNDHCHQEHRERTDFKLCRKCSRYVKCENISIEQHMEECQGPVPYICLHCNKEFKYESSLKSHIIKHNTDAPKRFNCEMCSYETNYKANLKKHMANLHGDKVKNVPCAHNDCDKMFYTEDTMKRHLKWHSEDRPFKCEKCQKKFKTSTALKGHEVIHDPARPFKCDIDNCTKDFRSKKHLRNHRAECHQLMEKNFKCTKEGCSISFFKRSHLDRHLMTHSDERKFGCRLCGRAFRHSDNLKIHMRTHTNEKPVRCDICDFKCRQKSSLWYHMKKVHKIHPVQSKVHSEGGDKKSNLVHLAAPDESSSISSPLPEKEAIESNTSDTKEEKPAIKEETNPMDLYEFKSDDEMDDNTPLRALFQDKHQNHKMPSEITPVTSLENFTLASNVTNDKTESCQDLNEDCLEEKDEDKEEEKESKVSKPQKSAKGLKKAKKVPISKKKKTPKSPKTTKKPKEIDEHDEKEEEKDESPKSNKAGGTKKTVKTSKKAPKTKAAKKKIIESPKTTPEKTKVICSKKKVKKGKKDIKNNVVESEPKNEVVKATKKTKKGKPKQPVKKKKVVAKPVKGRTTRSMLKKEQSLIGKISNDEEDDDATDIADNGENSDDQSNDIATRSRHSSVSHDEAEKGVDTKAESPPDDKSDDDTLEGGMTLKNNEKLADEIMAEVVSSERDEMQKLQSEQSGRNSENDDNDVEKETKKQSDDDSERMSSGIDTDFEEDLKPPPAPRPPPVADSDEGDIESGPEDMDTPGRDFESTPPKSAANSEYIHSVQSFCGGERGDDTNENTRQGLKKEDLDSQDIQEVLSAPLSQDTNEQSKQNSDAINEDIVAPSSNTNQEYAAPPSNSTMPEVDKEYLGQYLQQFDPQRSEDEGSRLDRLETSTDRAMNMSHSSVEKDLPPLNLSAPPLNLSTTGAAAQEPMPQGSEISSKRLEILSCDRQQEEHFQPSRTSSPQNVTERLPDNVYDSISAMNSFIPSSTREPSLQRPSDTIFQPASSTSPFMRLPESDALLQRQRMPTPFLPQSDPNALQNLHRMADSALVSHNNPASLLRRPTTVPAREEIFGAPGAVAAQSIGRTPFNWPGQEVRPSHWNQASYLQRAMDRPTNTSASSFFPKDNLLGRDFVFDTSRRSVAERNMFPSLSQPQRPELTHDAFPSFERFDFSYLSGHGYPPAPSLDYARTQHGTTQKFDDRYRQGTTPMTDFRALPPTTSSEMFGGMNPSFNLDKYMPYGRDPLYHSQHISDNANSHFLPHGVPPQHSVFDRDYAHRNFYQNSPYTSLMNMNEKQYAAAKLTHPTGTGVAQDRDFLPRNNAAATPGMVENQIQDPFRNPLIYNMMNRY